MQNFWKDEHDPWDLPVWRKTLLVCAIGSFFLIGLKLFNKEAEIYSSAASAPVVEAKQVYPVQVNHGYVRYVTQREADSLDFWRSVTPVILAALLATAGLSVLTYRGKRRNDDRQ